MGDTDEPRSERRSMRRESAWIAVALALPRADVASYGCHRIWISVAHRIEHLVR